MRNGFRLAFLALLAAILAGCASSGTRRMDWTRVDSDSYQSSDAVSHAGRQFEPVPSPDRTKLPDQCPDPSARWLSLTQWALTNLQAVPVRTGSEQGSVWRIRTANGELDIVPGSRRARWDGILVWLGHAPFLAAGDCFLHELDLAKNLAPLARGEPLQRNPVRTIVIDPGHGGTNTGARSIAPHLLEKDLTLDWALRLAPLLRAQGWRVALTRTSDVDLALTERLQIADWHQADLFLSLHFNSAHPHTEHAGLETFCLTPAGLPSTLTRHYDDDSAIVFPNNAHDHDNLVFAYRLHRSLLQSTQTVDRGIRRARFMGVLRNQDRAAVLLEAGYLSNPDEARRIATPAYRQRLAEAVAAALAEWAPRPTPPHPSR